MDDAKLVLVEFQTQQTMPACYPIYHIQSSAIFMCSTTSRIFVKKILLMISFFQNFFKVTIYTIRNVTKDRSTHPAMFCEKDVIKNFIKKFRKIHREIPMPESLFKQSYRPKIRNFVKKETLARVFSCEFSDIFKNASFYRTPLVAALEKISIYVNKKTITKLKGF